jgi:hypothetical protein
MLSEHDDRRTEEDRTGNETADISETCGICTAKIYWTSPDTASCTNGHQFGQCLQSAVESCLLGLARCCLTFGSIQRPGVSKFCGICGRQYFDERKISVDMEPRDSTSRRAESSPSDSDEDARQLPGNDITVAQVLLSAANRCIYCGGKFIG